MPTEEHKRQRIKTSREVLELYVEYLSYSPDLAPSDYHLFTNLKKHMGGNRLNSNEEVKTAVKDYLEK